MKTYGITVLAEMYGSSFDKLNDSESIKEILIQACKKAGMTCIGVQTKKFIPQGVSCVLFLEESHMSIHTWPEDNFACIDVFTCGTKANPFLAIKFISKKLEAKNVKTEKFNREMMDKDNYLLSNEEA